MPTEDERYAAAKASGYIMPEEFITTGDDMDKARKAKTEPFPILTIPRGEQTAVPCSMFADGTTPSSAGATSSPSGAFGNVALGYNDFTPSARNAAPGWDVQLNMGDGDLLVTPPANADPALLYLVFVEQAGALTAVGQTTLAAYSAVRVS